MSLWRRRQKQTPAQAMAADIERLVMETAAERARCVELGELAFLPPLEAMIASLTRMRVGLAEGRVRSVKVEVAAIDAAHEQIRAIGRQRGAA